MQENIGRESRKDNDLFFTCSLIDYIARKTKNTRQETVDALGRERIAKIYEKIVDSKDVNRYNSNINTYSYMISRK